MAAIYANASVTIIAAQGDTAHDGLYGILCPRELSQEVLRITEHNLLVERIFPFPDIGSAPWYQRGWMFQEQLFSRRRILFENDSIRWECNQATYYEDIEADDLDPSSYEYQAQKKILSLTIPALHNYNELVRIYNKRRFTYPKDALPAFAGITSALDWTFEGGFL
ncbi:hypothetical protein MMC14_010005 [Varicellaria rhodocarpa]|nr:hypothetical protein [Varicellaria rhodocarpa]